MKREILEIIEDHITRYRNLIEEIRADMTNDSLSADDLFNLEIQFKNAYSEFIKGINCSCFIKTNLKDEL